MALAPYAVVSSQLTHTYAGASWHSELEARESDVTFGGCDELSAQTEGSLARRLSLMAHT